MCARLRYLAEALTWTEEGLEYEEQRQASSSIAGRLGLNEESKAVNSAAVKSEDIGQEEDMETLDASEAKRFRSLAATVNNMSSDRSRAIRHEGSIYEDGEANSRQLEVAEEGRQAGV